MIFAEGLDRVFSRHHLLAEAVRRAVAVWTQRGPLELQHRRSRLSAPTR